MNVRMSLATGALALALGTLSACGTDDEPGTSPTEEPTTSQTSDPAPTSAAPSGDPQAAKDLVGDWRDEAADWTVHFKADGTYVEDFEGVPEFRSGTYEVADGVVSLVGGDGNTDQGTIKGGALQFKLGTLERQ